VILGKVAVPTLSNDLSTINAEDRWVDLIEYSYSNSVIGAKQRASNSLGRKLIKGIRAD